MLYKKAVYINDDGVEFYDYGKASSTVIKNKGSAKGLGRYELQESYRVESVDFVKYLENFPKDEYELYIQMNVEGAEFCILDKMLETEIFNNLDIRQFYIDYHTNFEGREEELKNKVKEHKKLMMKYFAAFDLRPKSGNPEDFYFSDPIAQG